MSIRWSMVCAAAAFAASAVVAAEDFPSVGPASSAHKSLQERCHAKSQQEREQCMRDAEAADEKAGRHCDSLTMRARDQCLADAQATQQQQASDQAAGGPQSGATTSGVPLPATASPGEELKKQ
jgi:hypothetical protein